MADSFGLKIGLEGEKEFKKALADINQSFKVLGSEMKLATSQFDKNDKSVEALAARNKVLQKEIDEQTTKIDTLRKALQNAATSFGENDRRTQNWQIQLNNAEAALNDMNRELDENEKAIKEGGKAAEESGSKFEGFGKVLKTVGVALGAVAVAAGAAAVKLGKEVIAAYADYEQLVGGVDTLFKDSSQEIQRYAANAYKTAGLSANEYMETVTGFSASLIQSLGGDTEKAAKYADMAITDMSDNANKMGTDMSSIQNAYQGFAKQNYTMLDNLKLGYGGTKQEMERLLADAEKISGVKYDISSYADVVEAIHVMQESMDIAGTTAKEAEATISGSVNALKSAVSNLIVGFGDADADMELLCNNMVDAFKTVVANIIPVIENIVADFITSGSLVANIIKAGVIQSQDGSSYWDLESGEVVLRAYVSTEEFAEKTAYLQQNVDGLNSYVATLTETVETVSNDQGVLEERVLNSESRVSELEHTVDGLSVTMQEQYIGGINYVQNSSGLNGITDDWSYSGTVKTDTSTDTQNNTISDSCFVLGAYSSLSQYIRGVVPGTYTISVRAKKTSTKSGYFYVTYNGNKTKYLFNKSTTFDWTDYSVTLTDVTDPTLRIYCYCRDASIYLADIMISEGAIPRKWTPAPNEIYTQEVKIDKRGIEVSNSASSQRTVITNTEFAGYYNDEVIFTLNKDETQTKKTTVDGELTVGKTKFVPMPTASEGLNIVILD